MGQRSRRVIGPAAGLLAVAAATGVGLVLDLTGVAAASLYMLAVVGAAAYGGRWSGLGAAVLAFLGLNFFFTPPHHTFSVERPADLAALFVFLAVAVIVGGLFARVLDEHARVERHEQESMLLYRFTTALLSTRELHDVLEEFQTMAVRRFDLARCAFELDDVERLTAPAPSAPEGHPLHIPVEAGAIRFGTLLVVPKVGTDVADIDHRLLVAFAGQVGLVLERARLDAEVRQARTDAEISQIRAALFSSVTHDLRTPLSSIMAGVTTLLDAGARPDDAQSRELLQTMLEETDRLNRVVGNLLNLARARAGDLALDKLLTPFEDVVESVLTRLRDRVSGAKVRTIITPDLPPVWLDPIQMDQALTNILENALRHSPRGGEITIAVKSWQAGIHVRIADTGPGIPREQRERVFEPFIRLDRDRADGGTGLGLAIARAVILAHDGHIRMEGVPGGGAAAVIELPAGTPPASGRRGE